jgi:nucleotide-binding universal stress UspA family protein
MAESNEDAPALFAYDGSEYAKRAIREAARELRPGRDAIVLTVWQPFGSFPVVAAFPLPENLADPVEEEARKLAREGASLAQEVGFNATPVVDRGDPVWERVVAAAEQYGASIVVLGSHGRSGISEVLIGSVAAAAARHTDRSVLIVHRPEH